MITWSRARRATVAPSPNVESKQISAAGKIITAYLLYGQPRYFAGHHPPILEMKTNIFENSIKFYWSDLDFISRLRMTAKSRIDREQSEA